MQLTSLPDLLLAHCSKHVLWMLFPQAALHQTISSFSGSNSVKQMGQSPETSLRLDGESDDAEVSDEAGAGAAAKISRSSLMFVSGNWDF